MDTKTKEVTLPERPQRVTRETRTPVSGPRELLTVRNKDENYVYRWVKDLPGRIQRFLDAGYEVVMDKPEVGQSTVDKGSRLGSATTRNDGANVLVLMRIPREWYNEDQDAKQREVDATEKIVYGEGIADLQRNSNWQPAKDEYAGRRAK